MNASSDSETGTDIADAGRTHAALKKGRKWLLWTGILMIAVGVLAIAFPAASTLAAELIVGGVFVLAGLAMLLGCFSVHGAGPFFAALLWSLLTLAAGAFLVFNPAAGAVALTVLIAALFMVHGAFEAFLAFDLRPGDGWRWVLVSAALGILCGILIAAGMPDTSLFILGLLVGLNFLSTGIAFVVLANRLSQP